MRVEFGPALAQASMTVEQRVAMKRFEAALRAFRAEIDALGQSREISLAHSSLDVVGFWGSSHISTTRIIGSTPAQRSRLLPKPKSGVSET